MAPDNIAPLNPAPGPPVGNLQIHDALKWVKDMDAIGNPHAKVINHLLPLTLIENQQIKATLMLRLAPLMRTTIGARVAKVDIMAALDPIRELLGGPPHAQAGPPPAPDQPLVS
jgi:hypothetical protein